MFIRLVATFIALLICSCVWTNSDDSPDYLTIDDSEYPYANLPRMVIETEDFAQIRDRKTELPAKMQIYGEKSPESEILDLTIRGRGNSSFTGMPKPSYSIEFQKKQEMFGMPKDKNWALIANSADKTLLKNFITYKLAKWLGAKYSPRGTFVELYLNRQYQGVYLLTETIKVGYHRVNIPKTEGSFLLERGPTEYGDEHFVITEKGTTFCIVSPKEPNYNDITQIKNVLSDFEKFLNGEAPDKTIHDYLDLESYLRFYWIQELSKNMDGAFKRSIYLTWQQDSLIQFGPIWDFDVAYGNWTTDSLRTPVNWYIRPSGWNRLIFNHDEYWQNAKDYWKEHRTLFVTLPDSISKYAKDLSLAAENEFKRWPVLQNTENWTYKEAYNSYSEAIDSLNSWTTQRFNWIDKSL